jgi:hypothetical protein
VENILHFAQENQAHSMLRMNECIKPKKKPKFIEGSGCSLNIQQTLVACG